MHLDMQVDVTEWHRCQPRQFVVKYKSGSNLYNFFVSVKSSWTPCHDVHLVHCQLCNPLNPLQVISPSHNTWWLESQTRDGPDHSTFSFLWHHGEMNLDCPHFKDEMMVNCCRLTMGNLSQGAIQHDVKLCGRMLRLLDLQVGFQIQISAKLDVNILWCWLLSRENAFVMSFSSNKWIWCLPTWSSGPTHKWPASFKKCLWCAGGDITLHVAPHLLISYPSWS